jgi:type II secretory pathway component GspD/PulD (secretin)
MKFRYKTSLAALVLSLATAAGAWAVDDPAHGTLSQVPLGEQESGWIIRVIPLQYANAEELAPIVASTLPPGLRVAPYAPTNSLVIYGRPHRQ